MTRRTLIQAIATLCSWPFMRRSAHAEAVKAIPTPPKRRDRVVLRVMDGETLVQELWVSARSRAAFLTSRLNSLGSREYVEERGDGTVFHRVGSFYDQLGTGPTIRYLIYDYVSGPKWWVPSFHITRFGDSPWFNVDLHPEWTAVDLQGVADAIHAQGRIVDHISGCDADKARYYGLGDHENSVLPTIPFTNPLGWVNGTQPGRMRMHTIAVGDYEARLVFDNRRLMNPNARLLK